VYSAGDIILRISFTLKISNVEEQPLRNLCRIKQFTCETEQAADRKSARSEGAKNRPATVLYVLVLLLGSFLFPPIAASSESPPAPIFLTSDLAV